MDHVFGFTVANDVSERTWQLKKNGGQSRVEIFGPLAFKITDWNIYEVNLRTNFNLQSSFWEKHLILFYLWDPLLIQKLILQIWPSGKRFMKNMMITFIEKLRGWLDDNKMQDSNTNQLIFDVTVSKILNRYLFTKIILEKWLYYLTLYVFQAIIEWISQFVTLAAGDVIITGTPGGVGLA